MKKIVFAPSNDYAPLVVRLLLAIVLFPHGAQKLLGWFGGFGYENSMKYFTDQVHIPALAGLLVIVIEFFGPVFLVLGLATRVWSLGILAVMTGIVITTFHTYFFMDWFGSQPTEGYEFFLLAIGMSLSLVISGGGRYSFDALIAEKRLKSER